MDITKIDKNFVIVSKIERDDIEWHSVTEEGFANYGLINSYIYENQEFTRLPLELSRKINLYGNNTAGGRVRFVTNSSFVAVRHRTNFHTMPHMPLTGSTGFDIYVTENGESIYRASLIPPHSEEGAEYVYESLHEFSEWKNRDITINFPLYTNIKSLEIGLKKGADIKYAPKYRNENPVVFYGSSITQGGCASRPGNSYQGFLSRKFDMDYINLGFSGSAKGEPEMAEYIASIPMTAFIYDYDHNAPTEEWLQNTHYNFYKIIRIAQPNLPILCVSRPAPFGEAANRRKIIIDTVERAKNEGDSNIYFLDGSTLFGENFKDCCTVDGCHPNDLGFYRMAKAMEPFLEIVFNK